MLSISFMVYVFVIFCFTEMVSFLLFNLFASSGLNRGNPGTNISAIIEFSFVSILDAELIDSDPFTYLNLPCELPII